MIHESGIDCGKLDVTFCDTGNEHDWTYAHISMLHEKVHPITVLKPELPFFPLAFKKRRFPSTKARFCTEFLKIYPTEEHIRKLKLRGLEPIAISGVRADESEERRHLPEWDFSGNLFCMQWRPLIRWTLKDVLAIHKRYSVPLNPLYGIGAMRVGCWPCIMSRKSEIRTIALKFPERIDEIRRAEQEFEKAYGRYSSFFPATTVPERFRTKSFQRDDGTWINVASIDDVVRWSMTGARAEGSWEDDPVKEPIGCGSGFCE
jgi:3'-phosphoadenosine 5'-phosphosulfate sulfotransferase (PAPS reductase)/FAD synthetase